MNSNTNNLLVRSKARVQTTSSYFKDPIIKELFPMKENVNSEAKIEPSSDSNKGLEVMI